MKTKLIQIGSYQTSMHDIEFETNRWITIHPEYDVIDIKIVPYCDVFVLFALVRYENGEIHKFT